MKEKNKELKSYGYLIFTNFVYAIALNMFLTENNIAAGGFLGIATILSNFIPVSVGVINALMNIPGLVYAYFNKGFKYIYKTLISIGLLTLFIEIFSFLPTATNDMLTACIIGGTLYAIGVVSMNYANASAGGSDLIARMINDKFPKISLGKIFLAFDVFCVMFAIISTQNIELGIYATITIVIYSTVSDKIFLGRNNACVCYVISKAHSQTISREVISKFNRSVTIQKGIGAYENAQRDILMIVVKPNEVFELKKYIYSVDNNAFVIVTSAKEVLGSNFSKYY